MKQKSDAGVKLLAKKRVYELAKELNTTSKRLMEKQEEINIVVKNHMSFLEEDELEALYDHIGVIRHKDDKSNTDDNKTASAHSVAQHSSEAMKELKKEAKKAPRIIRTTEIYLDSKDEEIKEIKANDAKSQKKPEEKRKKNDFVRVETETSGLRPGLVRETKPEYMRILEEQKKSEASKAQTNEKKDAEKNSVKEVVKKEEGSKQTAEIKDGSVNMEGKVLEEVKATVADSATNVNLNESIDKDKKTNDNRQVSTDNSAVNNEENAADTLNKKDMDKKNNNKKNEAKKNAEKKNEAKKNEKNDNKGGNAKKNEHRSPDMKKNDSNRPQDANKQNSKAAADKNREEGRTGSKKSLEIPKVELTTSQKEEFNSQRAERREYNKDAEKDSKRELRKEQPRSAISGGRNKNHKVIKNVFNSRKGVSEVLSDDFEMDDFYFGGSKKSRKIKKKKEEKKEEKPAPPKPVVTSIKIAAPITVKELAEALKKTSAEVIKKLMSLGIMATLNQELDFDTAAIVADEFGVKAEEEVVVSEEDILFDDSDDPNDPEAVPRPPVVVVMGHVDHGKTSLLDAIKKTNVTEKEAGGITQHIGAYMVKINNRNITFLDTPGHEAFTAMRARGAQVTDIAVLVVAADDGVMPQTIEAINHAKAANVTIIVAINKIDKPTANPEKVKQELTEYGLIPEEWGGDTIFVEVSAKKGVNIDYLLEMILLAADMLELKANPNKQAKGTVIEAKLDKDKGPVVTVLVQRGTLCVGDSIIVGTTTGRIRAMTDDKGHRIKKAGPSTPVEILGLHEVPEAGETFYVITDEKTAKQLIEKRKLKQREQLLKASARVTLDDLFNQIKEGKVKELNIIVKADVQGSVEALKQSLEKLSNDEVRVKIIHGGVGSVTETDVTLAQVSNAIIIGFNVRPPANVIDAAKKAGVDLRLYTIIYNAIEDIEAAMKGMLEPTYKEVVIGHVEIRQIFKVSGVGTVGGGYVTDGKITRNANIRLVRDGIVVHEGKLGSLKRFKDDVREVAEGYECGLSIEKFNDIKEGDVVEVYVMEEVKE